MQRAARALQSVGVACESRRWVIAGEDAAGPALRIVEPDDLVVNLPTKLSVP